MKDQNSQDNVRNLWVNTDVNNRACREAPRLQCLGCICHGQDLPWSWYALLLKLSLTKCNALREEWKVDFRVLYPQNKFHAFSFKKCLLLPRPLIQKGPSYNIAAEVISVLLFYTTLQEVTMRFPLAPAFCHSRRSLVNPLYCIL